VTDFQAAYLLAGSCLAIVLGLIAWRELDLWLKTRKLMRYRTRRRGWLG
jgi:hypothetical protein